MATTTKKAPTKRASKTSKAKAAPKAAFYGTCGKGKRCERGEGRTRVILRDDFKSAKDGKFYHEECLPSGHQFVSPESLSPKAGKKRPTKAPAKAKATTAKSQAKKGAKVKGRKAA